MLFTPEFMSEEQREIVLVSNHGLSSPEAVRLSIAYNKARIAFGLEHMPEGPWKVRVFYDVRGQNIPEDRLLEISKALSGLAVVEFKR
jgi:hypothetical protein